MDAMDIMAAILAVIFSIFVTNTLWFYFMQKWIEYLFEKKNKPSNGESKRPPDKKHETLVVDIEVCVDKALIEIQKQHIAALKLEIDLLRNKKDKL
jgi:hypothetical protein